jgi:pimeloyl-ACP methyl ester carboxylesterase
VGTELAWVAAHASLYPLGMLGERKRPGLAEVWDAQGTPILLVHGFVDNRSIFTVLRRALRRRGFERVVSLNYSVLTNDVATAAAHLQEQVEQVCQETGYERVHVIGHSLGGIVARYYVQRLGGDARIHTLVTLGAPHRGTQTARLVPLRLARQLRPGSDLLAELAEPATGCRTRFVAYWSDLDQLMLPSGCARLEHPDLSARNVLIPGVGHMSLPIDRRVVRQIAELLAELDSDGGTLTSGVPPLSRGRAQPAAHGGQRAAPTSSGRPTQARIGTR